MGEALDARAVVVGDGAGDEALRARFQAVVDAIMSFRPREPHHRPNLFGGEASIPFERILAGLARGREAIDLAIGEGLRRLEDRDQLMDLGYSRMTDYAREELGLPPSTARDKVKLARELETRPLLREAVRSGTVSPRQALEILPVARGAAERTWISMAGTLSVRELHSAVRGAQETQAGERPGAGPAGVASHAPSASTDADQEPWTLLSVRVRPEHRLVVEEAMRLAGESLGRGAIPGRRLEAIAQEFLGGYGELEEDQPEDRRPMEGAIPPGELEKALEIESNGWDWLEALEPVAAPELSQMEPEALHARLQDLVEKREGWDEAFGMVARVFVQKRLAAKLGFANLGHYLQERLGMSRRAFEQRVWLERRMEALPQLRHALAQGEVSYEKARLVAGVADFDTVNQWIRRAAAMTCVELERAIATAEDAQACVRERFQARVPERAVGVVEAGLRRAAQVFPGPPDPGECLVLMCRHFIQTWGPLLRHRQTLSQRVQERDGFWCTVPGCSRPSAQDHHLVFKSHGGGNGRGNQTALCAPHHLRGIHGGRLRVSGTAPDRLVWQLAGGRPFTAGRGPARRRLGAPNRSRQEGEAPRHER